MMERKEVSMASVLIADDEKDLTDTLKEAFTLSFPGISVITAHDGMEAYRKARNQSFNLICTDLRMPKLNGADFIRALREQNYNQDTPIFLISGFSKEDEDLQLQVKSLYVFEKPFAIKEVISKAKEVMETKKATPPQPKFQLDVNFINPFVDATQNVLVSFGNLKNLKSQKPFVLQKGQKLGLEISGVIPLVSPHFKGTLAVGFPSATFTAVASAMLGETHTEITPEIEDAAAELANIIYGQTKIKLNEKGFELGLSRPSIIRGHDHTISPPEGLLTMVIPFDSSAGPFYIQICV
jgi:chemotaxis protein CheX